MMPSDRTDKKTTFPSFGFGRNVLIETTAKPDPKQWMLVDQ